MKSDSWDVGMTRYRDTFLIGTNKQTNKRRYHKNAANTAGKLC